MARSRPPSLAEYNFCLFGPLLRFTTRQGLEDCWEWPAVSPSTNKNLTDTLPVVTFTKLIEQAVAYQYPPFLKATKLLLEITILHQTR